MTDTLQAGERKVRVLEYTRKYGPVTTEDLQRRFDLSASYARDVLRSLKKERYLEASGGGFSPVGGVTHKEYSLTGRGRGYLSWYGDEHGSVPEV